MSCSFIVTHMWCSSFHGLLLPLFEFINSRLEQNKRNRNGAETVQGVLNCWCCLTFLSTWGWYAEPTRQCRVSSCIPHESVNDNIFPSVEIEFHFFACLPLRRRQHRVSIWTRTDKDRSQDRCSWLEDDRWCLLHSSQAFDTTGSSNYVGDTTENLNVRIICKWAVDPSTDAHSCMHSKLFTNFAGNSII